MHLTIDRLESPIGTLLLVCNDEGRLYALEFEDHEPRMMRLLKRYHGEVTLVPGKVPTALRRIPAGTTLSYGALAATIGYPTAMRAVGAANGANCLAIVVPCHRVIGANGTLTGYASGLPRKRWLLAHEGLAPTL